MTPLTIVEVRAAIAARAGCQAYGIDPRAGKKGTEVFFTPDHEKPPTLQRVTRQGLELQAKGRGQPKHQRNYRRVVVGATWLRINAPELWAVFAAARLLGTEANDLIPTLREKKR